MKNFWTQIYGFSTRSGQVSFLTASLVGVFAFGSVFIMTAATGVNGKNDLAVALISQQSTITGEWTAELNRKKPGEIYMSFHRRSDKGGFSMNGDSMLLSELQGITAETISSGKANVTFNIVREAGTLAFEGFFRDGRGAGFWTFTPSQNFASAMRGRGYTTLTDEDLLRATMHNLTTKYIEDLKSAGYDRLEFQQLLRAASHEITPAYIRELQSAGYSGLTMEELIRASNHEVNGAYIRDVRAMGFDKQPLEKIIRLRNHEITQEFINRMKSAGFDNLSIEQLIRLKNHEVTPEFVNGLRAEGYSDISSETAIRLKNHEVDRAFIQRVKARGFTNLTLDQLIRLRSQDIIK
jgi:uncharacterized protein (UPF0335 family)